MTIYFHEPLCATCHHSTQLNSENPEFLGFWLCTNCDRINELKSLEQKTVEKREFAARRNDGKPELSYVDMNCLIPCASVLAFGAKKYSRNNWKKGMPVTKILDSLMRHIGDLQNGKVLDEESKLAIIGHIQCNAMFLGNPNNQDDITEDNTLYS